MDLDYDIYSYIVSGISDGTLVPQVVKEKVFYQVDEIDSINLNDNSSDNIRYKLYLVNYNGKKVVTDDGEVVTIYESIRALSRNYDRVICKKNIFKRKEDYFIVINVPKSVKVPIDKDGTRLYTIEKGKWIDITNVDNIKFYSNERFNLMFEEEKEDSKRLRRGM